MLLEIKRGMVPYHLVSAQLEQLVADVQLVSARSQLPETSDRELADQLVLRLYRSQIDGNV